MNEPKDFIKSTYVDEFLRISEHKPMLVSNLEKALMKQIIIMQMWFSIINL